MMYINNEGIIKKEMIVELMDFVSEKQRIGYRDKVDDVYGWNNGKIYVRVRK